MALFDLSVGGIANFARIDSFLTQRTIARDPLSGLVDSANKVFFSSYAPIQSSGSVVVRDSSGSKIGGTFDADTGEIELTSAPSSQPVATYTFTPYTVSQQLSFLIQGFQEMESRWFRGWALQDVDGVSADENSANIYVVNSSGSDPSTGQSTFGTSQAQIGFFMSCVRYVYLLTQLTGSAIGDFMWRESMRGMTVDQSKRPGNLDKAVERAEGAMVSAMYNAQDEHYTAGEHLGGFIGSPVTDVYVSTLEWQQASMDDNLRQQRGQRHLHTLAT